MEFNKYQTQLSDEILKSLNDEVKEQLIEYINSVPYIKNLISKDRKYAKDLPRKNGKIIVDVTKPHILENMDYFRPSALYFQKYGCYTKLRPNPNPNSDYYKWLIEEVRRCQEGYVRESDGEWVTGYMYFYLNYTIIVQSKIRKGTKQADRIIDFPEIWEGVYYAFHYIDQMRNGGIYNNWEGGQHGAQLARRGASKSYELGSMSAHNFIFGENKQSSKKINTVVIASQKEYLIKDGTLNKFMSIIDFCAENTQFPSKRLTESIQSLTWVMGYKDQETNISKGSQNAVYGVSADDLGKLRGKRGIILVDEFGSFPNLISNYNVWLPSVQEGDIVFGMIFLVGTAGDKESDFSGACELMYNPKGYNLYALPNVYDKETQGKKDFVYFFPSYINRKGCYDENGNSDVIKALIEILKNRYKVKHNSSDPSTIITTIAEQPITPAEAIVKTGVNIFPVNDISNRISQLDNSNELNEILCGEIIQNKYKFEFKPNDSIPIRDFPHKSTKLNGSIEILNLPEIDKKNNEVYRNRYIASLDPYENDQSDDSKSLGSLFVLDLMTDKIVAEYTGRPMFAEDFYENVRKICLYYNATLNYENNKKGLFSYFSKMNCTYLLCDTLQFLKDKNIIKSTPFGNTAKGTTATQAVNNYAKILIRDWLMKPIVKIEKNEKGEEIETTIPNLYTIKNRALLRELMLYNTNGNFDRISSLGMLMLLREERIISYQSVRTNEIKLSNSYLGNDKFFKKNYDKQQNCLKKIFLFKNT